ncbi:MAG TPA: hypothetical protein VK509_22205 [Polyangiales bacterium]|nr:hypothetical protein [Polyangiales bacterium]
MNRYESFTPRTIDALHDECSMLLERQSDATIRLDDRGIVERCVWVGEPTCMDNCGEGFLLRTWQFGPLEVP